MGQIGPREIILLAIIVLLVFGAKRMPDIARSLGKSMRILKSETQAMKSESQAAQAAQPTTAEPPATKTIQAAPGDVSSARPAEEVPQQKQQPTSAQAPTQG